MEIALTLTGWPSLIGAVAGGGRDTLAPSRPGQSAPEVFFLRTTSTCHRHQTHQHTENWYPERKYRYCKVIKNRPSFSWQIPYTPQELSPHTNSYQIQPLTTTIIVVITMYRNKVDGIFNTVMPYNTVAAVLPNSNLQMRGWKFHMSIFGRHIFGQHRDVHRCGRLVILVFDDGSWCDFGNRGDCGLGSRWRCSFTPCPCSSCSRNFFYNNVTEHSNIQIYMPWISNSHFRIHLSWTEVSLPCSLHRASDRRKLFLALSYSSNSNNDTLPTNTLLF